MKRSVLMVALMACGVAGCSGVGVSYISPNDPQYARSGAPRMGEPTPSPDNAYNNIQGLGDSAGGRL
jgi:hypothetical protein